MSILDDAIREHLALKRAHGANDADVKKLEDEAFGPPQRPDEIDPLAEAPTEFLLTPSEDADPNPAIADEDARSGRREPNIADLQEAPPAKPADAPAGPAAPGGEPAMLPGAAPPSGEIEPAPASGAEAPAAPAEEEQPAGELALPPQDTGPNTAERHVIADQPTEMFDVQSELSGDTSASPPTSPPSPSDEQLVDAIQEEPRSVTDEHDEYFSEQRLSDELDQALEAPLTDEEELPDFEATTPPATDEHEAPATEDPAGFVPTTEEGTAIFDVESEAADAGKRPAGAEPSAPPPEAAEPRPDFDPDTGHEDVLEDTPDFLENAPEDDDLWFEQKPPKDFDFDD